MTPRPRHGLIPLVALLCMVGTATMTPANGSQVSAPRPSSSNWVRIENQRAGTSSWQIPATAKHGISGFADKVTVQRGADVRLYVDTTADSFKVRAYRMGYYRGLGGRKIWRSSSIPGDNQPNPTTTPVTNMVETAWQPSTTVHVRKDWPEGTYLLKLVSSVGGQAYIPLIVRNDDSHAALVIQHQVTTWQAYNTWGGRSLYVGPDGSFATRSRVVSFDRPYGGRGAGGLLTSLPFVVLAEKQGLEVTYSSDLDLHARPNLVRNHRALISLDHDEYWSTGMRDAATAARADGVNIAFLGANAIYRHIRLEPSPLGDDRHVVAYKNANEDPLFGVNNAEVTVNWRAAPVSKPESELLGAMYECNPVHADMVVDDAGPWVFKDTGVHDGARIPGAVDMEYDRIFPNAPTPGSIQVMAHSPLTCKGQPRAADMTYYTTRDDAGVFDIGSQGWVKTLRCFDPVRSDTCDKRAVRITLNILRVFAKGPAGRTHPSVPNTASFGYALTNATDP